MIKNVNQIGTTETYDPSYDFSWMSNLRPVNVIITKSLTDKMIDALLTEECKKSCILHLTVTGWGSSYMEPKVPPVAKTIHHLIKLIQGGFDVSHVVLRLDPIIPTTVGLSFASTVLSGFSLLDPEYKVRRCRVSVLDQYDHVKKRFKDEGFTLGYYGFHAPDEGFKLVDSILDTYKDNFEFESCAEPKLSIPKKVGCIGQEDIDLINPEFHVTLGDVEGKQRLTCLCPNNKVNIIKVKPSRCPNKCLYCYWRD